MHLEIKFRYFYFSYKIQIILIKNQYLIEIKAENKNANFNKTKTLLFSNMRIHKPPENNCILILKIQSKFITLIATVFKIIYLKNKKLNNNWI